MTQSSSIPVFEAAVAAWAGGSGPVAPPAELVAAVLVEGASDRAAVLAAARVLDRDLAAEGVAVLPMGGAMSVRRYVALLGASRPGLRLRGLCDAGEVRFFERAGLGADAIAVCRPDLEGELIHALGERRVEELLDDEGDLRLFRMFQQQPAQRGRATAQQLHRFLGTTSGRKEQYGRVLTAALTADALPAPLRAAASSR
ncbi:TOPRIM nucleotidyl transferase/hydrolase domain-containing protein [Leifsonia sp. NPDC080035]|uniref:TOPRIM nucleotidyl transferase/hydrolase domain-containing protein n=1 Tax=Leifsonia sp. NPDC080035 TaxID=3143936 RepID=A0AAU7GE01_9MICO